MKYIYIYIYTLCVFKLLSSAYYLSVTSTVQGISSERLWLSLHLCAAPLLILQAISSAGAEAEAREPAVQPAR